MSSKVISSEELKRLPIEKRIQIIDSMTVEELDEHLGIKPIPRSAWKNSNETAAQTVRRLRESAVKHPFVW